jgi:hypothetical protein
MKRLLMLLLALPLVASAQFVTKDIVIRPVIETTSLDSVVYYWNKLQVRNAQHKTAVTVIDSFHVDKGSAVIKYRGKNPTPAAAVASVAALQNMGGTTGIPSGAYLVSTSGDTLWTMSDTATATSSGATINSDTISFWAPAARYTSLRAGMRFQNSDFALDAVIDTVQADSNGFTVKKVPLASSGNGTVRFGYFTSLQYSSGDALGFPFLIADTVSFPKEAVFLQSISLVDTSKQSASVELVLFNHQFTPTADNAAFAATDADMAKYCLRVIPFSTYYSYAENSIATEPALNIAVGRLPLWGQLVSKGTPTYLSVSALTLRLVFAMQ